MTLCSPGHDQKGGGGLFSAYIPQVRHLAFYFFYKYAPDQAMLNEKMAMDKIHNIY